MSPLHQWLLVRREERLNGANAILLPHGFDMIHSLAGIVESVSAGVKRKGYTRALDIKPGDRILYSSRIDAHKTKHGDYDLIEEGSVIGLLPQ